MSATYQLYELSELQGEHEGIIIRTLGGTEISIRVEHNRTLVLFPLGNHLEEPDKWGHLSVGVVALDRQLG